MVVVMKVLLVVAFVTLTGLMWGVDSFPYFDIVDKLSEAYSEADRALKTYVSYDHQHHSAANKEKLKKLLRRLSEAHETFRDTPMPEGPVRRYKGVLELVTDQLEHVIAGVLGETDDQVRARPQLGSSTEPPSKINVTSGELDVASSQS